MKNYIFLRGMKRKRDLKDEICIAIKDCNLSEFKKLLHESPGVIYEQCYILLWNIYNVLPNKLISGEMNDVNIQKKILRIIIRHEQFDSSQIVNQYSSNTHSTEHISLGAFALSLACDMSDFKYVKILLTLGVDPNEKVNRRRCGMCYFISCNSVENVEKCLAHTLEHGLDVNLANYNTYEGPILFVLFIGAKSVSGVKMLLRYGANITDWMNWRVWINVQIEDYTFCDDELVDEINYMFNNHKSYLPTWTPRIQRRYPQEFHDIAVNGLSLFKRLNERSDAKICPDMRRLLISYVADEWKKR